MEPTIVALPVMDHEWVTVPPAGKTVEVYVLPVEEAHTASAPAMEQLGVAFTTTVFVQELVQPFLMILSVRVKEPSTDKAFALTDTEAPVTDPTIVASPVIDHACVTVPPAGKTVEV